MPFVPYITEDYDPYDLSRRLSPDILIVSMLLVILPIRSCIHYTPRPTAMSGTVVPIVPWGPSAAYPSMRASPTVGGQMISGTMTKQKGLPLVDKRGSQPVISLTPLLPQPMIHRLRMEIHRPGNTPYPIVYECFTLPLESS